jgi:Rieske 2Fe-2S family protein
VGTQKAVGTGPNAILLVQGADSTSENGGVRAFANTCRHRGHELLACNATTKGRSIVCPYHSWSYRLDGRLRNAPGFRDVDGFEPDKFGLAELRLVNWHGWLFVDSSGEDAEFTTHVAGLDEVVGPYRPEDLTIVARHSYELATNWKVIAENYQECYHCSTIHPSCPATARRPAVRTSPCRASWMGAGCRSSRVPKPCR